MVTKKRRPKFVAVETPDPKTQTEWKHQARSISYHDAKVAVEWLNATQRTPAHRRVLMVRRELEELGTMLNELRQKEQAREQRNMQPIQKPLEETPEDFSDEDAKEIAAIVEAHSKSRKQIRERHDALNKKIARYTFIPVLEYSSDYGIWRFNAVPKRSRGPRIAVSDGHSRVRADEGDVIAALCRLAANRELHKVRLCEMCGEHWRVSERKMDRFCTLKCREAFYAKSSEFQERKARNQRNYRNNLKEAQARGLA